MSKIWIPTGIESFIIEWRIEKKLLNKKARDVLVLACREKLDRV